MEILTILFSCYCYGLIFGVIDFTLWVIVAFGLLVSAVSGTLRPGEFKYGVCYLGVELADILTYRVFELRDEFLKRG